MKTSTFFAVVATAVLSYASPVPEEQSAQGGYPPAPPPGFPGPQPGFPSGFPPAGPAAPGYAAPGIGRPIADPGFGHPPAGGPWGPPPGPPAQPWGPPPQPWGPPPGQCPGSCGGGPPPHPFYPPPPPPPPGPCPTCFLPPPPPPNGDGCGNGGQVSCCNSDNSGDFLNVLGGSCQLSLLDAPCATHCCQVTQVNEGFSLINIGQLCDLL